MPDDDGFTTVRYKFPKHNKHRRKKLSDMSIIHISPEKPVDFFRNSINQCKTELECSSFFHELRASISNLICMSGPSGNTSGFHNIVCYGIGKISECPIARYQFALLLLLWEHLNLQGNCYIYDPVFSEIDEAIIKDFKLDLITMNEEAKRTVVVKTLFFVPHGGKPLYNNILWANWGVGLSNVCIFGNSFTSYQERIPWHQLKAECGYIARILPHVKEVELTRWLDHDDIFNDMTLHCFTVEDLPSSFWEDQKEPEYSDNIEIILNNG